MSEPLAQTTSATATPKTKDHDNAHPAHAKPKHAITTPINGNALVPVIDPAQLRAEFSIKAHLHTAEGILDVALLNRKVPADKLADHYSQAAIAAAPHLAAAATELAALAQSAPQALNGTFEPSMAHLTSALTKTDQVIRRSQLQSNAALRSLFTAESQLRNTLGLKSIDRTSVDEQGAKSAGAAPEPIKKGETSAIDPTSADFHEGFAAHCEPEPGPCKIKPSKRADLILKVMGRVQNSQERYMDAVRDLKLAELLKPKQSASWLVMLGLDLLTLGISSSLKRATQNISIAAEIQRTYGAGFTALTAADAVLTSKIPMIATTVKRVVDKGKASIADMTVSANIQGAASAFLATLEEAAGPTFQTLRESMLDADDETLFLAFIVFDAHNQSTALWRAELSALLARFNKSGLPELGQRMEGHMGEQFLTRTLYWVNDGSSRTLQFLEHGIERSTMPYSTGGEPKKIALHAIGVAVPKEFEDLAVAMNISRFGEAPKEFTMPIWPLAGASK
jgi:hypothetical protein